MKYDILERRALDLADGVRSALISYRKSAGNVAFLDYDKLVELFEEASDLSVDIRAEPSDE